MARSEKWRRLLCLVLSLALLPVWALADHGLDEYDATVAFDYTIDSIDMDVTAYPADQRKLLTGLADLLAVTRLSGDAAFLADVTLSDETSFRINVNVELGGNPDTLTDFELYGVNSHYYLESSLLNGEKIVLNHEALLEFAMKTYYHLEMPIQYLALAVSPYATTFALEGPLWFYNWYVAWPAEIYSQDTGFVLLPKELVMEGAQLIQDNAESDRPFNSWITALFLESGYSDAVFERLNTLTDWVDALIQDEGIAVQRNDHGGMTWTTGGRTLYAHLVDGDHESWTVDLPDVVEGCPLYVNITRDGRAWQLEASLKNDEDTLLDASASLSYLPEDFPFEGDVRVELHLAGGMAMGGLDTLWTMKSENGAVTLTQTDPATQKTMLTIRGTWKDRRPMGISTYLPWLLENNNAMNILSVNDSTLPEFINKVKGTVLIGGLNLAREMPASSFQSLFELLDDYNIMDVLTGGLND